ncbi:LOW QUALITY PROTEIN: uncharacterized protein LOC127158760, partial [Labeo rohita]|uniref:LOW QUALITY PROTEIN: uncharacterized protein LOC127158760 n=1 Tax=Labeo rohita TaxID=84645 RepID=UPI0021E2ABBF
MARHARSVTSGAAPEAVFAIGDNCVKMPQERMTYFTRCLQELPRITVNDVNRIMPKKKGFRMRRTPRPIKSKSDDNACICSEKLQLSVVAGSDVRAAPLSCDVNALIACSVVAAIKHVIAPVCTWVYTDVDDICVEGSKLATYVNEASQKRNHKKELCKLIGEHNVFGKKWNVEIGLPVYRDFGTFEEESVMYEKLQEYLLRDGVCLLNLHSAVSAIIHHKDYFVVVDCATRDVFGMASGIGTSVAVFNTCLNDLMVHIRNLRKSLDAQWFAISSISVEGSSVRFESSNISSEVSANTENSNFVRLKNSIRGSFHQGNEQFKYGGLQCMAIALVSVAKHKVYSVFSWQTKDVDRVVVLGDELYTDLRDTNRISQMSNVLCVHDLPKQTVIDGDNFLFQYGEFVSGEVDVVEGELIDSGACSSLSVGLETIFAQYDTCLLTVCSSTCAIISQNGQYALVDSHARSVLGMIDESGTSVVVYFSSLKDLFNHICLLSTGLSEKQKPFEIAGVLAMTYSSDVQFISDEVNKNMTFSPISKNVCQTLCIRLNVDLEKINVPQFTRVGLLGVPCKNDSIVADGNCFFRAISQAVTGTQKYHRKIRLAVVQQLEKDSVKYQNILRTEYSSVSEYINKSKIRHVNTWATEVEIQATADYLGINVFTFFDGRWLKYTCNSKLLSNQSIYLENCNGNHYETVVCVYEPELQSCYGYCKTSESSMTGYYIRSHIKNEINVLGLEKQKPHVEVQMQFSSEQQQQHSILKTVPNETCAAGMIVDCDAKIVGDSDVEIVKNAGEMTLKYSPVSTEVAQTICNELNLDFERDYVQVPIVYGSLGIVCKTHKVINDGNSFFRAVAQVISGSEKSHRKVRLAVVKYLENHKEEHIKLIGKEYASISEYITNSKMKYVGYCASDVEFQGTANALGVNLFISNGEKWTKYICMGTVSRNQGIYLKQCDSYFEPVICVQHGDKKVCFDLCKVEIKKNVCKRKYEEDVLYKEKKKNDTKRKYQEEELYKEKKKNDTKRMYHEDVLYKGKKKNVSKEKYQGDVLYKELKKDMSKRKYQQNMLHKKRVMEYSKRKYSLNQIHRQHVKAISIRKYHGNPEHKKRVKVGMKVKRQQIKVKAEQLDFVMQRFFDLAKHGPDFVCCVCQRLLFKHQVLNCNRDYYKKKVIGLILDKCISEEYLHKCNKNCVMPCHLLNTPRGNLWICYTCHYKLNKGEMPPECSSNNLRVEPIPPELACLNSLEQHLIALHIPFMKMLALPRGGQNGVHGPVTCVPANIVQTSNLLPLSSMEGSLLPVKLKRKLTYKGHYKYQFVDTMHIKQALKCLKQINVHYKDVEFNEAWLNGFCREDDLLACVRQLGVPTWFCSFSSADMRWKNLLFSILKQEGRTETVEELEWADRCELLRRNPVTAARMFDFRWHCFLREVLMSSAHPIGKIKDYFYRVEFQQRGSPHVHCLFWIENAPLIDKNTDEEVIQFIDKYVTCELPSSDDSLLDVVTSVQQHSKRHSKSCKKKNTVCRFNFPRPPSARTFICRGKSHEEKKCICQVDNSDTLRKCVCDNQGQSNFKMKKEQAGEILSGIKKTLSDDNCNYDSVEHLFKHLGINQASFEAAYKSFSRNTQIVLKREVNEVWVNQYSKPLLKCWNANLDIQYVVDAYACVVYIISYISKSEREMGLLLGNAQREACKERNISAKDALKNLGSVYLHNRDVCAQESVYRLTNMPLKECSRKVVFVPTGDNVIKMSLPLNVLRKKAATHELTAEEMWMTSIVDRYKNRPKDLNDMCMATFASEYRILSKNEKSKTPLKLNNGCGFITKRTRTQPAVVRYVRFSEETNPESFYQSIMQLFLPYHLDMELKPPNFETFEQFYKSGHVTFCDGSRHSVKSVVDLNRKRFELEADELDNIQNTIDSDGIIEDGWCELCPELEIERLMCEEEMKEKKQLVEEDDENIPDLASSNQKVAHLEKKNNIMCRSDGLALIRSLNDTQLSIFYQIRQWCLDKIMGKNPDPLHVFITGGAGTGKSHLIKAIQYEAMRLLSTVCRHPDNICVLLTAPTGIAAYNLHAATIHHSFSIGKDVRLPYTPLGEDKLNCLRAKYSDLQILIIDEISMVDHNLLAYIHGRLRQIKQTGDFSPFGNVSIIAVGDFFQLPPVKGKPLYVDNIGINLWSNLFSVVELKTIVRQKDNTFAELLNRIRIRTKVTPMLNSDIDILKKCETGEISSALHIFPTNRQVSEHNVKQLIKICPEYFEIDAQDFIINTKTGKHELKSGHHSKMYNTCLDETLLIGKGARVMLCKNVDVMDGLVNGACGTVTNIVYSNNDKFPETVYVKFDDHLVGAQRRKSCISVSEVVMGSTGIKPEEEKVNSKGGLRRQFPLKLAWACTVHKVQGISVDEAVVSLKKIFAPGQAYVALSRVRTLSGLIIQDFEEKVIYCKDSIKDAVENMPTFFLKNIPNYKVNEQAFSVFLMNVQSLRQHLADLILCIQHLRPNCIAITETWLPDNISFETVKIDGYSFHSHPRSLAYTYSNPTLCEIKGQQHGGVGMYTTDNLAHNVVQVPNVNLECLVCSYTTYNILIVAIYRPPSYPMSLFKENLGKLLDFVESVSTTTVVMGDFNDNILKSLTICKFITDRGFIQHVTQATTEKGTLIDHVYVKTTHYDVETMVLPTYFSDHEGILCSFTSKFFNTDEAEFDD